MCTCYMHPLLLLFDTLASRSIPPQSARALPFSFLLAKPKVSCEVRCVKAQGGMCFSTVARY